MSTVFDTTKCPQCGGVYTYNFNCNTQEEYGSCISCGRATSLLLRRDPETGAIDRDEDVYELADGLSFVISDYETDRFLYEKPLTEETTTEDIENFMWKKETEPLPSGKRNVFHNGEPLWVFKDLLGVEGGKLYHKRAVYLDTSMDGYGVVGYTHEKGQSTKHLTSLKKEDVLSFIEKSMAAGDNLAYVTWWNPEAKQLETLYGEMPTLEKFGL